MSQEYTKDKDVILKKFSGSRFSLKALLVVVVLFAVYLMAALLSFDPFDPSWSQTSWHGPIHNLGGGVGAWMADMLFFIFGVLAYAIPPVTIALCWAVLRRRDAQDHIDLFTLSLRLIGALALILASCGLAALNIDDLYYFASGGVMGSLLNTAMVPWFNNAGRTLLLLSVWAAGLTLFTGWSWLTIAEKIGTAVLGVSTFMTHRSRPDEHGNGDEHNNQHVLLLQENALASKAITVATVPVTAPTVQPSACSAPALPLPGTDELSIGNPQQVTKTPNPSSAVDCSATPAVRSEAAATTLVGGLAQSVGSNTFTPAFSATSDNNLQVKKGCGPELPRPNPVKLPTRRELASYGIKLPSQRLAEQQQAATKPAHEIDQQIEQSAVVDEDQLQQTALRQAWLEQQQQRYGEQGAAVDFNFSPMADLIDDTPMEPVFTLSPSFADLAQPADYSQQVAPSAEPAPMPTAEVKAQVEKPRATMDSLFHPFLMRHEQPMSKPTTPLPSLDLLTSAPAEEEPVDMFALQQTAQLIEARLNDYRIKAEVVDKLPGPVITRFELDLAPGVKAARISNLSRDLARSLSTVAVRIVEVIPGKPYVGLELPNKKRQTVYLREVLDCPAFKDDPSPLTVVLGKDIAGEPVVADLAKMPHLLVAGTTGSGKSVGVNAMILSMLYKATPQDVRFIMIDPKMLELSVYGGIPHLLTEVVTDMKDAANALRWCVGEMERRYKLMSALGVRNLASYNDRVKEAEAMGRPIPDPFWKPSNSMGHQPTMLEKQPFIVVMVDEFADLMMTVGKKVEELIARLAQKARAAGIHLVLATQRPSVDVITGLIKANIPTRIAFTVSSKIDSRTILDQGGAESLLGMGDMLYMAPNSSIPVRVHGAFVRDQEVHAVVQDWKARGRPQYINNIISGGDEGEGGSLGLEEGEELDPLFDQAVAFVVDKRRASISGVQRQFRIGYNRAARIIEQMEAQTIVSAPGHNGNREVLSPPLHE